MTLLIRYLFGFAFGIGSGTPERSGDELVLGKPYIVLRTGKDDARIIHHVYDGACETPLSLGKPYLSLRAGVRDGNMVELTGNQELQSDGTLQLDKPYIAHRVGVRDGKIVMLVGGKNCCYCPPLTSNITARIISSVYSYDQPLYYRADLRTTGLLSLPPEISGATEPVEGWAGYYGMPLVNEWNFCSGPPPYAFNFSIVVRKCDMKIWIGSVIAEVLTPGVAFPTRSANAFTICDDPDDVIECSPFNVVRKMDLANPAYTTAGPPTPFTGCSGEAGGCAGEEYIQLMP